MNFTVNREAIANAAEKAQSAREAGLSTPPKKQRAVAKDPFKCKECRHSTDMHDAEGCRVITLAGPKCDCSHTT